MLCWLYSTCLITEKLFTPQKSSQSFSRFSFPTDFKCHEPQAIKIQSISTYDQIRFQKTASHSTCSKVQSDSIQETANAFVLAYDLSYLHKFTYWKFLEILHLSLYSMNLITSFFINKHQGELPFWDTW